MGDIEPEATVGVETVFSGRLIDALKVTVRLPGGKSTEREIVVHRQTVAVVPVLEDGRIVMVRQFRKAAERVLLELPAGGIDGDETPEDAVRREMKEETGYDVGRVEPLCAFFTSPGFTTEYMHLFRASGLRPGSPTEETDQIEVVPMALDDALAEITSGQIADAKTILGLLWQEHATRRG
jgi:ADP-ribose pyrophosphatase